jgi:diguanylate cyclase (GGDEF)-like protein
LVSRTTKRDDDPRWGSEVDRNVPEGSRLRASFRPLDPGGERLILLTIAVEPASEPRFRDALYFDGITGLPNRFLCLDRLRQNIARSAASGGILAVLVVAIARWSLIERSFGRATADGLLAAVAARLSDLIGGLDTAARLGEARFAVLACNVSTADDAARTAQTLVDQLNQPVVVGEREIAVGGTVGIAVYPADGDTAETLIAHAEAALDRLPASRETGYQFYTSAMHTASSDRLLLEQQLIEAVERNEFLLLYQPQISFASSRIVGMEALIRWRHPALGMVPPAEFIPLAEETGAIVKIGEWVLDTACRELQRWFATGVAPLRLAINISGRQYNDANLVPGIRRMLEATGFPPHLLELELTESVIMEDVIDAAKRLGDLHALGINLAVDDFGTGYSSLSYLKRFPIRSLKVDRSFVRDIAHDQSSAAIARAIIAFGSALGLKVIAEGVESHDQYDILRSSGCDELQGYLFSRPVPAEDARKLATERRHLPLVRA